jgi:hypothetical protein
MSSIGYNRIGFSHTVSGKYHFNNHQIKLGACYYSFDNLFIKNTIGPQLSYAYLTESKSGKSYFYNGLSATIFREKRNLSTVNLKDIMLVNGIGLKFFKKWTFTYQLGMGIAFIKNNLNTGVNSENQYYNYEMAIGISYLIYHNH